MRTNEERSALIHRRIRELKRQQANAYNGEKVYAVVMANSSHTDMSAKFLEYLMQ